MPDLRKTDGPGYHYKCDNCGRDLEILNKDVSTKNGPLVVPHWSHLNGNRFCYPYRTDNNTTIAAHRGLPYPHPDRPSFKELNVLR